MLDDGRPLLVAAVGIGCSEQGTPTVPDTVRLTRFVEEGPRLETLDTFDLSATGRIYRLDLLRGPVRSFVLWQAEDRTAVLPPGVTGVRLNEAGQPEGDPFLVTPSASLGLAASAAGEGFAIAYLEDENALPLTISVSLFDENADLTDTISIPTTTPSLGDVALLTSPEADAFLLAWQPMDRPTEVELTRIRCAVPPHRR
ncbi:MAG: hypothetical protein AAGA56_13190 [Myxococcota bacterium]